MTARVKMPAGTSSVSVAGQQYSADEHGIVEGVEPTHVAGLVSAGGRELDPEEQGEEVLEGFPDMLPFVDVGAQEGELASESVLDMARGDADLSPLEWNNLPASVRRILFDRQVDSIRTIADAPVSDEPRWESMTKAQLADWVRDNGGEPLAAGTKDQYVNAARQQFQLVQSAKADQG